MRAWRSDSQPLDQRPRLQQTTLRQGGYYAGRSRGGLTFSRGDQPVCFLDLEIELDVPDEEDEADDEDADQGESADTLATGELILRYRTGQHRGVQVISLLRRPSNLGRGGGVWYFVCPVTDQPCRTLYLGYQGFVSRAALPGASYDSQRQAKGMRPYDRLGRLYRQAETHQQAWLFKPGRKASYGGRISRPMRRLMTLLNRLDQTQHQSRQQYCHELSQLHRFKPELEQEPS